LVFKKHGGSLLLGQLSKDTQKPRLTILPATERPAAGTRGPDGGSSQQEKAAAAEFIGWSVLVYVAKISENADCGGGIYGRWKMPLFSLSCSIEILNSISFASHCIKESTLQVN
jgi:hypothetical protein